MLVTEPIRLLIVDDSPQVRQGLRSLLPLAGEAAGLRVEIMGEAADGESALEQVARHDPDVVLLDLEMPGMDGYVTARVIKARRPRVRVVILTVHGDETARGRALAAGADAFVDKGAPTPALIHAIRGVR